MDHDQGIRVHPHLVLVSEQNFWPLLIRRGIQNPYDELRFLLRIRCRKRKMIRQPKRCSSMKRQPQKLDHIPEESFEPLKIDSQLCQCHLTSETASEFRL